MLSDKPTVPKPIRHWHLDPGNALRLREIINDPVFELACASLLAAALPTRAGLAPDPQRQVVALSWLAGYRDFTNDLRTLTQLPADSPTTNEWEHLLTPADQ